MTGKIRLAFLIIYILLLKSVLHAEVKSTRTDVSPVIDGMIEDLWQNASKFNSFKQIEPDILAQATVKTEAYFFYDQQNFYMAMKLYQKRNTIRSSKGRKDTEIVENGDWIMIAIDPFNNANSAYFFLVNPQNSVMDGLLNEYGDANFSWDATFISSTEVKDEYWSVEIKVPLNSISFQNKETQDWGIHFYRKYTENNETLVNKLMDINGPYRLSNYEKLTGLDGLNKRNNFILTPYLYSHNETDFISESSTFKGKTGGELRYTPNASLTILATINPDYAQVETDKEIINVSDLPTEYPEKRPFFTESTDFYNNAAFYSRNIADIKTGLKIRQLGELLKFDVTSVLDGNNHLWLAGHTIIGDDEFYGEVIGGLKNQPSRRDYNITTHLQKWFFDKRLPLSSWIGTINQPGKNKNEWETVNSIRWITRNFTLGYWSHYKTQFYNPNSIGLNYLSNEFHHMAWSKYSIINPSGIFRNSSLQIAFDYYDLTSPAGNSYNAFTFTNQYELHFSEYLGNWALGLIYTAPTDQKFRYRNITNYAEDQIFEDAFSRFILVDDKASSFTMELSSDNSKSIGFTFNYTNNHVRKSPANNISSELYWKVSPDLVTKYSLGYINIKGSEYQASYKQVINRLQVEYNITDRLNIRGIIQPNIIRLPNDHNYQNDLRSFNLAMSWQYVPGSFIYFVYNRFRNSEEVGSSPKSFLNNNQTFVLKINRSITL